MRTPRSLLPLLLLLPYVSSTAPAPSSDRQICHPNQPCYPAVFVPTDEFQRIYDDQEVPAGLHIRMNIYTGEKEAKKMAPGDEPGVIVGSHDVGVHREEVVGGELSIEQDTALLPVEQPEEGDNNDDQPTFQASKEVKPEALEFSSLVSQLENHSSTAESALLTTLSSLQDLAHDLDWGLELITGSALNHLLHLLRAHPSPSIRNHALIVLGSALSNNPKAAHAASSSPSRINIVSDLLLRLRNEPDAKVRGRVVYALDKAIKGPAGMSQFEQHNGQTVLLDAARSAAAANDAPLVARIAVLLDDNFLNGDMREDGAAPPAAANKASGLRLGEFCAAFRDTLAAAGGKGAEEDAREKVLAAYLGLRKAGEEKCHETVRGEGWWGGRKDL